MWRPIEIFLYDWVAHPPRTENLRSPQQNAHRHPVLSMNPRADKDTSRCSKLDVDPRCSPLSLVLRGEAEGEGRRSTFGNRPHPDPLPMITSAKLRPSMTKISTPTRSLILFLAIGTFLHSSALRRPVCPVWGDEAFVGLNIISRGYADLLKPLDYAQVAPPGFLLATLVYLSLGMGEYAMHSSPCSRAWPRFLFAYWAAPFSPPPLSPRSPSESWPSETSPSVTP